MEKYRRYIVRFHFLIACTQGITNLEMSPHRALMSESHTIAVLRHNSSSLQWIHLGVWGELASHKDSLTHRPSSQGWASKCPLGLFFSSCVLFVCKHVSFFVFVVMIVWVGIDFFPTLSASVLYTCIYT